MKATLPAELQDGDLSDASDDLPEGFDDSDVDLDGEAEDEGEEDEEPKPERRAAPRRRAAAANGKGTRDGIANFGNNLTVTGKCSFSALCVRCASGVLMFSHMCGLAASQAQAIS